MNLLLLKKKDQKSFSVTGNKGLMNTALKKPHFLQKEMLR